MKYLSVVGVDDQGLIQLNSCPGGGHAVIGLYLAKQLLDAGHSVTILNDGSQVFIPWAACHRCLHVCKLECLLGALTL